jgi:uncharacterized membrane protein HdeD (DUF308 family)
MNTAENHYSVWKWLRWLAVLPAAIGAYFAVQIAVGIAMVFVNGLDDRPDYQSQFIASIVGPYFLVLAGAKTAPTFRFVTALALTVLHAVFNGSVATLVIGQGMRQSFSLWWLILTGVVGIIASIVACIQIRKQEDTAVIRVYDAARKVSETREHEGDFKEA